MVAVFGTPDNFVNVDIVRDADWLDPLPTFLDDDGVPRNLTGKTLTITIQTSFDDDAIEMMTLSTATGDVMIESPATDGNASVAVNRATVINNLPAGHWVWVCVSSSGGTYNERFRGRCTVHEGTT